ncbi:hypothetical protein IWX46DRAFT_607222 [Phyllosticta citricarpa]|uniref:Uncharacterized protein n=1 Tax=Phyllosticta citricarpa TaxID=55181 RepID=A0ABR1LVC9_9PEZI
MLLLLLLLASETVAAAAGRRGHASKKASRARSCALRALTPSCSQKACVPAKKVAAAAASCTGDETHGSAAAKGAPSTWSAQPAASYCSKKSGSAAMMRILAASVTALVVLWAAL